MLQISGRTDIPGIRNGKAAALVKGAESGNTRLVTWHSTQFIANFKLGPRFGSSYLRDKRGIVLVATK
jgi:hypothetical protein